jgi:segregation and condensation protein A
VDEALPDPRSELVQQLLEYKRFKDAASMLEERGRAWQQRFPRATGATAMPERDPADEPIREVELWDLVSAFGRIVRSNEGLPSTNIIYDDTPIHVFMTRIRDRLTIDKPLPVGELFRPGMHKSTLVGIVLAILELVRDRTVRAEQKTLFGEIWLTASEDSGAPAPSDAT